MCWLAIATHYRKFQVFTLLAQHSGLERICEFTTASVRHDLAQAVADKLRGAEITRFETAPVGIAHKSGGVCHQDHALRVVEDLDIEIALTLQLSLDRFLFGDVEDQAA